MIISNCDSTTINLFYIFLYKLLISSRKRPALVTTTFSYFEVVAYESFDCIWNLNWYLLRSNGCFTSYVTMHAARKWKPLTTQWLPRLFPGQGGEDLRISSVSPAYWGQKWSEYEVKGPALPRSSPMVANDWCIIHVERVIDVWIRFIFDVIVLQFALLA